jgi:hypothetical protein
MTRHSMARHLSSSSSLLEELIYVNYFTKPSSSDEEEISPNLKATCSSEESAVVVDLEFS